MGGKLSPCLKAGALPKPAGVWLTRNPSSRGDIADRFKTHRRMLPQFAALKGKTADNAGTATKTGLAQTPVCNKVEGRSPERVVFEAPYGTPEQRQGTTALH
jgi:hypothetical protein